MTIAQDTRQCDQLHGWIVVCCRSFWSCWQHGSVGHWTGTSQWVSDWLTRDGAHSTVVPAAVDSSLLLLASSWCDDLIDTSQLDRHESVLADVTVCRVCMKCQSLDITRPLLQCRSVSHLQWLHLLHQYSAHETSSYTTTHLKTSMNLNIQQ